jgi:zeaxanthin glucosyltransferase
MSDRPILVVSLQVSSAASKGHLNPLIGAVQWLRRDGHQVVWLPLPRAMGEGDRRQVEALGVTLLDPPLLPPGTLLDTRALSELALDPARTWEAYRSFLLDPIPYLMDGVRQEIQRHRPVAAVVDGLSYTGIIACHLEGIPYVGMCAGLKLLHGPDFDWAYMGDMSAIVEPRRLAFARYGLHPEFRLFECVSPHANIVFTTSALAGSLTGPARTHLVGPTLPPAARGDECAFPWDRLATDRSIVYVAFGSVHTAVPMNDLIDPLVIATGSLGVQLVISSESLAAAPGAVPPHVLVVPYAPQLQLLPRVSAFVTHGGANSVMEGLAFGVPLLVVPLSTDQPWQAHLVSQAGAGLALRRSEVNAQSVEQALAALLDPDGPIRAKTHAVQRSFAAADGARAAARIIQQAGGLRPEA